MFVDALGSGLWMPFSLIFFVHAQRQSLGATGVALTAGALLGLVAGPLSGGFVDRRGPGLVMLISNAGRAVSFGLYPFAHAPWQVLALVAVTSSADRAFWTANAPLLQTVVRGREVDKFLGTTGMIRVIGLGVGAALSGVFAGTTSGLHVVAYANAATFALSAVILGAALGRLAFAPPAGPKDAADAEEANADRDSPAPVPVWRNRAYLQLCLLQVAFVLTAAAFVVVLPLVVIDVMKGPRWLPGTSIVLGNVVLAALQAPVLAWAARRPRALMLVVSVAFYLPALLLLAPGHRIAPMLVVPVVLLAAALAGVGEVISTPLMISAANESAPEGHKGRYSAVFQTAWGLANALGPLLYTLLLSAGNAVLWLLLGAMTLAVVPAVVRLRDRLPPGVLSAAAPAGRP